VSASITSLHVYPIKSCRGTSLETATVTPLGLVDDRHWMLVRPNGRFVTQRELPRMALIGVDARPDGLTLSAPGMAELFVPRAAARESRPVTIWKFEGFGLDCGAEAAAWVTMFLQTPLSLVAFDPGAPRICSQEWTRDVHAQTEFSDGFPILVISRASLADLNSRLEKPLPMERFRPNVVIDGVAAFDEDRIHELRAGDVTLRLVKPCARCSITTTDQRRGEVDGVEPLRTLKEYRFDRTLRGVLFGQNAIVIRGAGSELHVGTPLAITWK
jgi:uncharacterized protein YcbX